MVTVIAIPAASEAASAMIKTKRQERNSTTQGSASRLVYAQSRANAGLTV